MTLSYLAKEGATKPRCEWRWASVSDMAFRFGCIILDRLQARMLT
jgi:hypothetical protein